MVELFEFFVSSRESSISFLKVSSSFFVISKLALLLPSSFLEVSIPSFNFSRELACVTFKFSSSFLVISKVFSAFVIEFLDCRTLLSSAHL